MAKVTNFHLTEIEANLFYKSLQFANPKEITKVRIKKTVKSRQKISRLVAHSLLKTVVPLWQNLGYYEKYNWNYVGFLLGTTGYFLFVKEQCLRIKNGLSWLENPNFLHQCLVGKINFSANGDTISLNQNHTVTYNVLRKIRGKKTQRVNVLVTENLTLPLTISLSYKCDLAELGEDWSAKFFAKVRSNNGGSDIFTNVEISLPLSSDWNSNYAVLESVEGTILDYKLCFEFVNCEGIVLVDNLKAEHSSQNWAIDSVCDFFNEDFVKAEPSSDVDFFSIYPA